MRSFVPEYSLTEALDLGTALDLLSGDSKVRPIAGGTDIMVLLNAGKLDAKAFVSIRSIPELRRIDVADGAVHIGGAVTYTQIRNHALLGSEFPLLCQAASWTGGIANQNRGTLGGNIANASPAADSAPVLLAYDAELELASKAGVRRIPYSHFHTGYKQMQLLPGELISQIILPRSPGRRNHYGRKVGTRKAQAIAKVSFAAVRDDSGFRIAIGSVAPIPIRCAKTESFLNRNPLAADSIIQARELLLEEITPISDVRSTRDYRALVSQNLLEEFLRGLP